MATKKSVVTSNITAKGLSAIQRKMDGTYEVARTVYHAAILKTIKGNPETNGDIVNAVVFALSKGKLATYYAARESKPAWINNVHKLNNFLSSWCEVKKGAVTLLDATKKAKKAGSKGAAKAVTFSKSNAIAMLDKIAVAKGVSRKAKALALQLAEELEA